MIKTIYQCVKEVLGDGKKPILLGGEHTISIGGVKAASELFYDLNVIVLDAHLDMRDYFDGTAYSHACTSRRMFENASQLWIIGARTASQDELNVKNLIDVTWIEEFRSENGHVMKQIRDFTRSGMTYLSIDLDVLDPSLVPCVGNPEPNGLTWKELTMVLKNINWLSIVGLDLTELVPNNCLRSCEYVAATLLKKIIAYMLRFG